MKHEPEFPDGVVGAVLIAFVAGVMMGQWFATLGVILGFGPR